jgi:hypothetical protein
MVNYDAADVFDGSLLCFLSLFIGEKQLVVACAQIEST